MNGHELLRFLRGMSTEDLLLPVVTSDDPGDGYNFDAGTVEVGTVKNPDELNDDGTPKLYGPFIVIMPFAGRTVQ